MARFAPLFVWLWGLHFSAHALGLAGIEVQSQRGEPLRAEIQVAQTTADEWAQLTVTIASAERFSQMGLTYQAAISSIRIDLLERADGRKSILLTSTEPLLENFVDLLIQAQSPKGQWLKAFALMLGTAKPVAALAPIQPPSLSSAQAQPKADPTPVHTVQKGESASRIVQPWLNEKTSMNQMLVALLKSQPHAFIQGNVNLLREGVVLRAPNAAAAKDIDPEEARKFLILQQKDFMAYAQVAAQNALQVHGNKPSRQMSGTVGTEPSSPQPVQTPVDQLKLTQAKIERQNAESRLAAQRALLDAQKQLTALQLNVDALLELNSTLSNDAPTSPAPAQAPLAEKTLEQANAKGWLNLSHMLGGSERFLYVWAALSLITVLGVFAWLRVRAVRAAQTLQPMRMPVGPPHMDHEGERTQSLPSEITALDLDLKTKPETLR